MRQKIPFRLELKNPTRVIRGDWFQAGSASQGTVIVIHGYKGFKDYGMFPRIGALLSEQRDVITFNFSHNGIGEDLTEFTELDKFAVNTYSLEQEDLAALVGAIKSGSLSAEEAGGPAARPVYLLGHSKGGGAALIYALDHPEDIQGVISWNGISNVNLFSDAERTAMLTEGRAYTVNARTKQQMPLDRVILDDMEQNKERFNIVKRIGSLHVPTVLIQGERDGAHLLKGSARLKEAQPRIGWHLVPEGDHRFNTVHPYAGESEAFLEAIRLTQLWLEDQG